MDITLGQVQFAFTVLMGVGALAAAGMMWRLKGEFASKSDIKTVVTRIEQLERDQATLTARVDQVPTHEDIAAVRAAVAEVSGDVKALGATVGTGMQGIRDQLTLLMQHHLKEGAR